MDRQQLTGYGALTLALLVSLGFNIVPATGDQSLFVCPEDNLVMGCDRLSSTGITCYPNVDDNKGYKRCSAGWLPVTVEIDNETQEVGVGCAENNNYKVCITAKG